MSAQTKDHIVEDDAGLAEGARGQHVLYLNRVVALEDLMISLTTDCSTPTAGADIQKALGGRLRTCMFMSRAGWELVTTTTLDHGGRHHLHDTFRWRGDGVPSFPEGFEEIDASSVASIDEHFATRFPVEGDLADRVGYTEDGHWVLSSVEARTGFSFDICPPGVPMGPMLRPRGEEDQEVARWEVCILDHSLGEDQVFAGASLEDALSHLPDRIARAFTTAIGRVMSELDDWPPEVAEEILVDEGDPA